MPASRNRSSRFLTDVFSAGDSPIQPAFNFYQEEVARCRACLEQQREFYSDRAIEDAERALTRVMAQLEQLTATPDADRMVGQLLHQLAMVTGLFTWSDPKQVH